MVLRGKKKKGQSGEVTEEMLLNALADIRGRQREAEIEKQRKENELKSLQNQARKVMGDEVRLNRLSRNCARTEAIARYWNTVIDNADNAAHLVERIRTQLKSIRIEDNIEEFLDTVKLRDPEVTTILADRRENIKKTTINLMTQLEYMTEFQLPETEHEERAKQWKEKLLKEIQAEGASRPQERKSGKEDTGKNSLESPKPEP